MFRLIVLLPWSAWITSRLAGSAAPPSPQAAATMADTIEILFITPVAPFRPYETWPLSMPRAETKLQSCRSMTRCPETRRCRDDLPQSAGAGIIS